MSPGRRASPSAPVDRGRLGHRRRGACATMVSVDDGDEVCGAPLGSSPGGRRVADVTGVHVGLADHVGRVAMQVVEAPGASVVTGHVAAPASGRRPRSSSASWCRCSGTGTTTGWCRRGRSGRRRPRRSRRPTWSSSARTVGRRGIRRGLVRPRRAGAGRVAGREAVFSTNPASMSAWLMVCGAAVQVVVAPGARVAGGQLTTRRSGRDLDGVEGDVPVFSTRNDQSITSPRSIWKSPLTSVTEAGLVRNGLGRCATGVETVDGLDGRSTARGRARWRWPCCRRARHRRRPG